MNFSFPQLLAGAIGALLIYSAIKGETPVEAIKKAMRENVPPAPSSGTGGTEGVAPIPPAAKYK